MSKTARNKGANFERDIARELNEIHAKTLERLKLPPDPVPPVQRNQNQSAVGGMDLIGTYPYAIECKRQESLSLGAWWGQAEREAATVGLTPALIYKQNRQPIQVLTLLKTAIDVEGNFTVKVEMSWEDFKRLYTTQLERRLNPW